MIKTAFVVEILGNDKEKITRQLICWDRDPFLFSFKAYFSHFNCWKNPMVGTSEHSIVEFLNERGIKCRIKFYSEIRWMLSLCIQTTYFISYFLATCQTHDRLRWFTNDASDLSRVHSFLEMR